ncbi:MAG: tRNA (guanine(10)-N(2))-dimethyltransferase [Candidatus Thermoplasmatota archaeon]|nr:tRNA (guanine(10)-N(2))-dimethyltransferase [Candidatus Thermoplasmatota archaeon]
MKTQATKITEGKSAVFVVSTKQATKGPGAKEKVPFYNPSMILNRDVSILVAQNLIASSKKSVRLLDGLAASGIRGIRFAHELEGDFHVTINDWNEESYQLIKKNAQIYSSPHITTTKKNLHLLLTEEKFEYIDIDPFGSPVYFFDVVMKSIQHGGIIACTATDTAALCGVYPKACQRRYHAQPLHAPCMKEIGLRILLGSLCREATKYGKGIEPLLCYTTDHYSRLYVKVSRGVGAADTAISRVSAISSKAIDGFYTASQTMVGPLWLGPIQQKQFIQEVRNILFTKQLQTKHDLVKLLDILEEEATAPPFFYSVDEVASTLKCSPPKRKLLFGLLRKNGYTVSRTHCTPAGFKTNAPLATIKSMFMQQK